MRSQQLCKNKVSNMLLFGRYRGLKKFVLLLFLFCFKSAFSAAPTDEENTYREPFSTPQEHVFGQENIPQDIDHSNIYQPFQAELANSQQQRISMNGLGLLSEPAPIEDTWFLFIPFIVIFIVMKKIKSKKKNTTLLLLLLFSFASLQAQVTPRPPVEDKDFVLCYGHKMINIFANDGYGNVGADGFPEGVTPPAVTLNHETAALGTATMTSRGLMEYVPNGSTGVDVITYTVNGNTAKIYLVVLKPFATDYYICANVKTTVGLYKVPGVATYEFRKGNNQLNKTVGTTTGWSNVIGYTSDATSVFLKDQTADWSSGYVFEYKVTMALAAPYSGKTIDYVFQLHRSKYNGRTDLQIDGCSGATVVGEPSYGNYGKDDDSFTGTILVNETFGGNNVTDPEYNPAPLSFIDPFYYNYYVNPNPYGKGEPLTNANGTNTLWKDLPRLVEGVYYVSKTGEPHWNVGPNYYFWNVRDDHTYKDDQTRGYFLEANAAEEGRGGNKTQFFVYDLTNLCTGTQLIFSAWMAELNIPSVLSNYGSVLSPNMTFTMALGRDADAPVIATYQTGPFPRTSNEWRHYGFKFNVPENIDHLTLKIENNSVASYGNDFALDDIQVLVSRPQATAQYEPCSGVLTADYNGGTDSYLERRYYAWIYNEFTDNVDDPRWEVVGGNTGIENTSERVIHDVLKDPVPGYYYRFVVAGDFGNIRSTTCRSASKVVQRPDIKLGQWVEDLKAVINPGVNVRVTGKVKYIGVDDRGNIPVTLYKAESKTDLTGIKEHLHSDSEGNIDVTLDNNWLDFKLIIGEIGDEGSGVDPSIANCPAPRIYEYVLERGNIKITPGKICSGEEDVIQISIANANDPNKDYKVDCFLNKEDLPLEDFRMEPFEGFVAPTNMTGSFTVGSTTVNCSYKVSPARRLEYTFNPNGVTGDIVLSLPIQIGNTMALTLKNSADLYEKPKGAADTEYQKVSTTDVSLYVGPRTTWWIGKADGNKNDWNDSKNWSHGIPMKCTYVHIPGKLDQIPAAVRPTSNDLVHYPELKNYDPVSNNFLCDTIHFHPGGEVAKTPYLDYEGAKVELEMKRDQWFMAAAPLRNMYFGDYWLEESYNRMQPTVYAMMYQTTNPELGAYKAETGKWSYPFNTLKENYSPGKGAVIKIDTQGAENINKDKKPGESYKDSYIFYFPKDSTKYQYYYKPSGRPANIFDDTPRTKYYYTENDGYFPNRYIAEENGRLRTTRHRFIYEDELAFRYAEPIHKIGSSYQFEILVLDNLGELATTVLITNPFMSHLDFNLFYSLNSTKIGNTFRMVNGSGSTDTFIAGDENQDFSTFHDGSTTTNSLIPPMQSFIVDKASGFQPTGGDELQLNTNMSVLNPAGTGYVLKSAKKEQDIVNVEILNKDGKREGAISLFYDENGTNPIQSEAFFTTAPSADGTQLVTPAPFLFAGFGNKAYSIHTFTGEKNYIPLGIRYDFTGTFSLKLNKISEMIGDGFDIRLVDGKTGLSHDLKQTPVYSFENTTKDVYGRFFLDILKIGSGFKDLSAANDNIFVYAKDGMIEVRSEFSNPITRVDVLGLQGQLLISETGLDTSNQTLKAPGVSGIIIVKVTTRLGEKVQKVILN